MRITRSWRPAGPGVDPFSLVCRGAPLPPPACAHLKNIWPARGAVTPLYSPPNPSEATVFCGGKVQCCERERRLEGRWT
jgi:hypothetical protein